MSMNHNFRTVVNVDPFEKKIDYHTPILFLGSCFSNNIAFELNKIKLPVLSNPYGVLYNPYSIQTTLQHITQLLLHDEEDFVYHNDLWNSLLHHSSFSKNDKTLLEKAIVESQNQSQQFLKETQFLFITFGTAWVYKYKKTNRIVANCHKIPEKEFDRFRLSVCDITDEYCTLIESLLKMNSNLQIVFTISPVRHWKDGATENQASKSILNVAIHQLCDIFENNVSYFPSFEIMMDDLRDYRFYTDDMLHPSAMAVSYIFDQFKRAYFTQNTLNTIEKITKITKAAQHRPFNPNLKPYKQFCSNQIKEIETLKSQFPKIDFSQEQNVFEQYCD